MLEYWEHVLALNNIFANSSECNIKILERGIELLKKTNDPGIKEMYGGLEENKKLLDECKETYKSFVDVAKMAKLQVQSFRMFGIGDINTIDESQNN